MVFLLFMSGGEGSERAHIAPTQWGEACTAKMSVSVWCRDSRVAQWERPVQALGVEARRAGVTRSALAGCISYDGGNARRPTDAAFRPALR